MPSSLDTLLQRHPILPELDHETLTEIPSGILLALATVPDPRRAQGRRYRSTWLLAIMACTIMAGHTGFRQMQELARRLTNHRNRPVPGPSTFHRFLKQLDPVALEEALVRWAATLQTITSTHLAEAIVIDGKELRSAKNGNGSKTHLMAATTHQSGLVLGQVDVHAKSNEIPHLPGLLELLARHYDLAGRVITLDALHTQRNTAKLITECHRAHYVFTLNGEPAEPARVGPRPALGTSPGHRHHDRHRPRPGGNPQAPDRHTAGQAPAGLARAAASRPTHPRTHAPGQGQPGNGLHPHQPAAPPCRTRPPRRSRARALVH